MPGESDVKQLELRIKQLEDQLKELRKPQEVKDVTAEEVRAYLKVRDTLAFDPDTACGINECSRCIIRCIDRCIVRCIDRCIVRCIDRCINECNCGPCNIGGLSGGGERFGGLGD